MTKKKDKSLENKPRLAICQYLTKQGHLFWRFEPTKYMPSIGRYIRTEFTPLGLPDIMVLREGKLCGLETKRPTGGRKSGDQILKQKQFELLGHEYHFVTSVDEVKSLGL